MLLLNKLHKLKKEKLWQKGELKEYYTRISTLSREYIELQFEFNFFFRTPYKRYCVTFKKLPENELKILESILKKQIT